MEMTCLSIHTQIHVIQSLSCNLCCSNRPSLQATGGYISPTLLKTDLSSAAGGAPPPDGRTSLCFRLLPRASAIIHCSAMAAAGHAVSGPFQQPVAAQEFMLRQHAIDQIAAASYNGLLRPLGAMAIVPGEGEGEGRGGEGRCQQGGWRVGEQDRGSETRTRGQGGRMERHWGGRWHVNESESLMLEISGNLIGCHIAEGFSQKEHLWLLKEHRVPAPHLLSRTIFTSPTTNPSSPTRLLSPLPPTRRPPQVEPLTPASARRLVAGERARRAPRARGCWRRPSGCAWRPSACSRTRCRTWPRPRGSRSGSAASR